MIAAGTPAQTTAKAPCPDGRLRHQRRHRIGLCSPADEPPPLEERIAALQRRADAGRSAAIRSRRRDPLTGLLSAGFREPEAGNRKARQPAPERNAGPLSVRLSILDDPSVPVPGPRLTRTRNSSPRWAGRGNRLRRNPRRGEQRRHAGRVPARTRRCCACPLPRAWLAMAWMRFWFSAFFGRSSMKLRSSLRKAECVRQQLHGVDAGAELLQPHAHASAKAFDRRLRRACGRPTLDSGNCSARRSPGTRVRAGFRRCAGAALVAFRVLADPISTVAGLPDFRRSPSTAIACPTTQRSIGEQAVLLGDRQERGRADHLAVAGVHAQVGFVQRFGFAQQITGR